MISPLMSGPLARRGAVGRCLVSTCPRLQPRAPQTAFHAVRTGPLARQPPAPHAWRLAPSAVRDCQRSSSTAAAAKASADAKPKAAPQAKEQPPLMPSLKNLVRLCWPDDQVGRARVVAAVAALLSAKIAVVFIPVQLGTIIDALSLPGAACSAGPSDALTSAAAEALAATGHLQFPVALLAGYAGVRLAAGVFQETRTYLFATVSAAAARKVSRRAFGHLHDCELQALQKVKVGQTQQTISRATKSINIVMSSLVFNIGPTAVEFVGVVGVLAYTLGPGAGAIACATMAGYAAFTTLVSNSRRSLMAAFNRAEDGAASTLVDSLTNAENVKYLNAHDTEIRRYDHFLAGQERAQVRVQSSLAALNLGQQFITSSGLIGLLVVSSYGVVYWGTPVGQVVAANALMMQLSQPLNNLGTMYRMSMQGLVDFELMDRKIWEMPKMPEGSRDLDFRGGSIELKDVSFTSPDGRELVKNLNLRIASGSKTAVVGPSGTGKSTLLRLLFRIYDPSSGTVTIDGQELRELRLYSIRRHIAAVAQESVLFNESIAFNVYPQEGEDDEDVRKALDDVLLADKHLDYQVGERGQQLSGGERQRVCIARGLVRLRNARRRSADGARPLLVLDEPTSALDGPTSRRVMHTLMAEGHTVVLVTHDVNLAKSCDKILCMNGGELKEEGTHDELLAIPDGHYKRMWDLQREPLGLAPNV